MRAGVGSSLKTATPEKKGIGQQNRVLKGTRYSLEGEEEEEGQEGRYPSKSPGFERRGPEPLSFSSKMGGRYFSSMLQVTR